MTAALARASDLACINPRRNRNKEKGVCLLQLPPVVLKRAAVFLGSIFWFCSSHATGPISSHWAMNSFVKCIKDGASDL